MTIKKFKMRSYILFVLLQFGMISCNNDSAADYASPDLDLVTLDLETDINLKVGEEVLLQPNFKNAVGPLSYIWTIDNDIVSNNYNYLFKSIASGQYFINVYVEDAEGKYTNVLFQISVTGTPLFDDTKVIMGYLPGHRTNNIRWDRITHFIYAYIYPKKDGTLGLSEMDELPSHIGRAKANNVKVLISLGGSGNYPGKDKRVFTSVINDDKKRAKLVQSITTFVRNNKLDGIDIYYHEFVGGGETVDNSETNKLLPFYKELREALPSTSIITAAVTGSYTWVAYHYRDIAAEMGNVLNFISVMAFDILGSWEGSPLGPHASIADAQNALNRYVDFGVAKEKLVLGVPFYGRDFLMKPGGFAEQITYADIISLHSPTEHELIRGNINRDGHNIFFDSQQIISQKTSYIKENGFKGITIWELGQDTNDPNLSLLQNIPNQF